MDSSEQNKLITFFNMENWLDEISEYTFPTRLQPISKQQAIELVKLHEQFREAIEEKEWIDFEALSLQVCSSLSPALFILRNQLETQMKEMSVQSPKLFAKTSGRSWKDVICKSTKLKNFFDQHTKNLLNFKISRNDKIISLLKSFNECSKVSKADEVMTFLVLSTRVRNDLHRILQLVSKDELPVSVAIREWISIHPSMEFRGIVWDGKLIGLSQYNQDAYFPHLKILKNKLEFIIKEFFHKNLETIVKQKFPYCVVDFAITRKSDNEINWSEENLDKIFVIELNAAWPGTDPCLYDWKDYKNFSEAKFELRILEDVPENALSVVEYNLWKEIVE